MHRYILVYFVVFCPSLTSAQQNVVRNAMDNRILQSDQVQQPCAAFPGRAGQVGDICNVVVYNTGETDAHINTQVSAAKQELITRSDALEKDLRQYITILQSNIKTLSDANDSLTKRLNQLECKIGKQNSSSASSSDSCGTAEH